MVKLICIIFCYIFGAAACGNNHRDANLSGTSSPEEESFKVSRKVRCQEKQTAPYHEGFRYARQNLTVEYIKKNNSGHYRYTVRFKFDKQLEIRYKYPKEFTLKNGVGGLRLIRENKPVGRKCRNGKRDVYVDEIKMDSLSLGNLAKHKKNIRVFKLNTRRGWYKCGRYFGSYYTKMHTTMLCKVE